MDKIKIFKLKDLTSLARSRGMTQADFIDAIIKFFIFYEKDIKIVDGNIKMAGNFYNLNELENI